MSNAPILLPPNMLPPGDPRHGLNGYANLRCRCEVCRDAHRLKAAAARALRKGTLGPGDPRHGTENGYNNYGCRCEECRTATGHSGPRRAVDLDVHGTIARYARHLRDGDTPCPDCRAACAADRRERRARSRRTR